MKSIVPILIFYILGIIIGLYNLVCIVLFLFLFLLLISYFYKPIKKKIYENRKYIIKFFIFTVIGIIHINLYNNNWQNISNNLENNNIIVEIVNLEKETEYQKTYKAKIINNKNRLILLKINKNLKLFNIIQIGDKLWINGDIQEIEVARNTGGFNYKEYLKSRKIYGIIKAKDVKIINNNKLSVNKIKNYIIQNVYKNMNKESADFCLALSIGYKAGLSDDVKESFNKNNLSHMLSISGMHISYLMLFINLVTKFIKSRYKSIAVILFLFFFMELTGNTPSVNRACLTIILTLLAPFFHKKASNINNIAIASMFLLIQNPHIITDLGFIYSFLGTFGIIFIYPILKEKIEILIINKKLFFLQSLTKYNFINRVIKQILFYCKESVLITISANIFILPIVIYKFNNISLVFILANLIIGPILVISILMSFSLIILNIFNFIPIKFIHVIYSLIINKIIKISQFFSNIECVNLIICTPKIYTIICIYIFSFICIYSHKNQKFKNKIKQYIKYLFNFKILICIILILGSILNVFIVNNSNLKIYFIDIGQGDCTLIVTPKNKKILIDSGGVESDNYDVGEKVLQPYLLNRGIKTIDYIMVSHFDTDHVKGFFYIMKHLKIKNAIISKQKNNSKNYEDFKEIAKNKKINIIEINKGNKINIENDLFFYILWPNEEIFINENALNNNSIVCKLCYKQFSMLFTGDIEEIAEKEILKLYKNNLELLKSTILKVAHHGSKTSSTDNFIKAVSPNVALIGVGKNNRYGHPNIGVIERLENLGIKIYRTDKMGEIMINISNKGKMKIRKFIS